MTPAVFEEPRKAAPLYFALEVLTFMWRGSAKFKSRPFELSDPDDFQFPERETSGRYAFWSLTQLSFKNDYCSGDTSPSRTTTTRFVKRAFLREPPCTRSVRTVM